MFRLSRLTGLAPVLAALALAGCSGSPEVETPSADQIADARWAHEISDLAPDDNVTFGELENGLRYAVMANDTPANTVAVRMVFNAGSLFEAEDQRGLAHFIEHMAFNGSTNVPEGEMVPLLERYGLAFGPDTNAFTGYDTVGYQLDLPEADQDTLDTAFFLLRETASELTLNADAIDRERGVILSEERVRNTPVSRWNQAVTRFRLPGTLVPDREPIGLIEVIETAGPDRFRDYYEQVYIPERGMISVVGAVDPEAIAAQIEAVFGDWAGPENPRPDPDLGTIDPTRPPSVGYFYDPEVFTILTVDTLRPFTPRADTGEYRFEEALRSMGNAILSRRLETIISTGQSPFLQAFVSSANDFDIADRTTITAVLDPNRWPQGVALIEQELRRALDYGFSQGELDEQMALFERALTTSAQQADSRQNTALADGLWSSWRSGTVFTHPASSLERFDGFRPRVTVEAVEAAFRAQWNDQARHLFMSSSMPMENAEALLLAAWRDSGLIAVNAMEDREAVSFAYTDFGTPGSVSEREEIDDLGLVRARFENGVAVTFKQTDFADESVQLRVNFGRGELEPRAKPAVDILTASAFISTGLGAHSIDDLSRVLAGRDVSTNFNVGETSFSLSASTTPTDLETQLQLYAAYMTDPGWRSEGLAQFLAVIPELRRSFSSSPSGILQSEVSRLLRSGDARYGFPTDEEIAAISLADMEAFLTPALSRSPIEITLVGDIDEAEAMAAIAATFGALPARAESWPDYEAERTIRFPDPVETPVELFHNGQPNQVMVNVYWPTLDGEDVRRRRTVSLLRAVFDLKLTERLREAEGFTYSTATNDSFSDAYPDYGYLWVGVDVQSDNAEATYAAINELAAGLANGDISEDEVLRARRPLMEEIEDAFESNGSWLGWLSRSWAHPDRLDRIRSLEADYGSISREELIDVAQEYLRPETQWRVSILPAEAQSAQ